MEMPELTTIATWVGAFVFVIALIAVGAWVLKSMTGGNGKAPAGFLRGRERRVGVVQAANLDGRRRLVLIRRDNVEHLIMTGGPVDVVIETGIQAPRPVEPPYTSERHVEPSYAPERNDDRVAVAHDEHQPSPGQYERE